MAHSSNLTGKLDEEEKKRDEFNTIKHGFTRLQTRRSKICFFFFFSR